MNIDNKLAFIRSPHPDIELKNNIFYYIKKNNPPCYNVLIPLLKIFNSNSNSTLEINDFIKKSQQYERPYISFVGNRYQLNDNDKLYTLTGFEPFFIGKPLGDYNKIDNPDTIAESIAEIGRKTLIDNKIKPNIFDKLLSWIQLADLDEIMKNILLYLNRNMTSEAKKFRIERNAFIDSLPLNPFIKYKIDGDYIRQEYSIPIFKHNYPALNEPSSLLEVGFRLKEAQKHGFCLTNLFSKPSSLEEGYNFMNQLGMIGHPLIRQAANEFRNSIFNY